jgi:isopentenyl diphosphate isomerase/L-lactate dehydrogenase-like FMN-dependent dehydrogenase
VWYLSVHQEDPDIFDEVEVYADGGIRYGADVLKLLALGVRAVGLGRPFLYANLYGQKGVSRVINLLELELTSAAANIGLAEIRDIELSYVSQ